MQTSDHTEHAHAGAANQVHGSTDLALEPLESEEQDYQSALPNYEIATYPADFTLEVLYHKWKNKEIIIPDFQRNFIWSQIQSSKLVESFIVGLPVPVVFFYCENHSQKYLVIDGQQRLKTVFYYFDGFFGPEKPNGARKVFKLKGLNQQSSYFQKTFEELSVREQIRFKNAVLRAFIVQQTNPNDSTVMFHIFERLNSGGTLLTNQEIRNCIYHGRFVNFLEDLNLFPEWRQIIGKELPDSRQRDIELLVRYLALREKRSCYKKPMKDFLSRFMSKYRNPTKETLRSFRDRFKATCHSVITGLGKRPFHLRSGLNAAVLDAITIAFSEHLDNIPQDISARYNQLVKDPDFIQNTSTDTTDADKINQRIYQASRQLFGA